MLKKAIISGIVLSSILLVGCNDEEVTDITITENGENDANLSPENRFLAELKDEISVAIKEQTALEADSIMIDGNFKELSVSVGFMKDVKVNDTLIKQIVKDSIKKVSETENVTISEDNIKMKIEKY